LLLDAPRRKLRLQAAPSLPEACRRALDGLSLEQAGGSCGAAITSREPVIVDDLDTLPPGDELRDLARKHGLRSCWILPLQKAAGEVVGTFHIYSRQPRRPEPHELALLERSGRVAALAIEQERTRKSLQESERILRRAQAMAHVGCWCRDFERNQVIWSEEAYRIFQIAPGTPMSYQLLLDFVHPEDRARVDQAWQNMRFGHPRNLEYRVVVKGQIRWIRSNAEVEMTPDGRLRRITGIVQDITPHRQAVAGQRASEERFRGIIEHSTQLHYEHSPDHVLTYVSPQSWHFLGCSPEEARVHWKDFLSDHPQNQEGIRATQRAIDTGTPQPPYELELLTRDGRKLWVEVHESPVVKEGRTVAIVGALLDITERKRFQAEHRKLEAHLRQQEKLDAVGTLAAGVAHEINNPISGIMGYADILREEAPEGSRIREFAGEILHESERVATIVRNLLTFARQEEPEHVPTSVPELIEATLSLVQAIVKQDHIRLETELAPEMPLIYCQFQQLQQVLMNLTTNARDALNAKYREPHPDKILRIITSAFTEKGKPWVRFTVEDHGAGIPPEVLDRIYEPFFTTKPRGKGTGLGLSISLGIIQDHRGRLRVETRRGHYTRFHVELPAHPPESEAANRAAPTP
jgi:PAS domain S-box-containing protein